MKRILVLAMLVVGCEIPEGPPATEPLPIKPTLAAFAGPDTVTMPTNLDWYGHKMNITCEYGGTSRVHYTDPLSGIARMTVSETPILTTRFKNPGTKPSPG